MSAYVEHNSTKTFNFMHYLLTPNPTSVMVKPCQQRCTAAVVI